MKIRGPFGHELYSHAWFLWGWGWLCVFNGAGYAFIGWLVRHRYPWIAGWFILIGLATVSLVLYTWWKEDRP